MLVLSRHDVEALLTMPDAIAAVEEGFRQLALGNVTMPQRLATTIQPHNGLHLSMPAFVGGAGQDPGTLTIKIVTVYGDNPARYGEPTIQGVVLLHDAATGRDIPWQVHRTPVGLAIFFGIGILAGMFGLGAGWANLPALNLLMGAPLKVSAGTSSFILSLVDSSAAWVYLHKGAVLPMIAVPSVIGMMLGAKIGAKLLKVLPAATVRKLVLALLAFAGMRALLKGLGIWN